MNLRSGISKENSDLLSFIESRTSSNSLYKRSKAIYLLYSFKFNNVGIFIGIIILTNPDNVI